MDTDKFKSVTLRVKTYNKLREMTDSCFNMPISLAKANEVLINKAYKDWEANGKYQTEYIPHPNLKYFLAGDKFLDADNRFSAARNKTKSLFERLFKK